MSIEMGAKIYILVMVHNAPVEIYELNMAMKNESLKTK